MSHSYVAAAVSRQPQAFSTQSRARLRKLDKAGIGFYTNIAFWALRKRTDRGVNEGEDS